MMPTVQSNITYKHLSYFNFAITFGVAFSGVYKEKEIHGNEFLNDSDEGFEYENLVQLRLVKRYIHDRENPLESSDDVPFLKRYTHTVPFLHY